MKVTSDCVLYIVLGSFSYLGLAVITNGPTNQTTCSGTPAYFNCVTNEIAFIYWLVNGQDPSMLQGVPSPATNPLSPGPGTESTLILPGSLSFSGASIVCKIGQVYSASAFLTILGSTLPVLTSFPHNSTSTSVWISTSAISYAVHYQVEIRNSIGLLVYNETMSDTQLVYTFPDPCDYYVATVTAIYGNPNQTCLQQGSVQLAGASPSAPIIIKTPLKCSLSAQGLLKPTIVVLLPQEVCNYNIMGTSPGSQPISYLSQKPINESIVIVSLPINLEINLTVMTSNSYGSSNYSMTLSTCEIIDVNINATSLPGDWQVDCSFISCAQSIGCLVFFNETFCSASKRYGNSSSTVSCPSTFNNLLPEPGIYTIKAYAVLSNGSVYRDCVYTGVRVLTKKEATTASPTQARQNEIGPILGAVGAIVLVVIVVGSIIISIKVKKNCSNINTQQSFPLQRMSLQRGETALMKASSDGQVECVRSLLDKGASADLRDERGETALMKASSEGHVECVKLLLDNGASANLQDENGQTALIFAVSVRDPFLVKQDLKGTDIYVKDKIALMKADEKHRKCAKLLLDNGAEVDLTDCYGQTALIESSNRGHVEFAKLLLKKGANIDCQDLSGHTALIKASRQGHFSCAEFLMKRKCNIDHQDKISQTALMKASSGGHFNCVKLLLKNGAQVDLQDQSGGTALMKASNAGHMECIQFLLDKRAMIDLQDKDGQTALMKALIEGHPECATHLLNNGASVNIPDRKEQTALTIAQDGGHYDFVKLGKRSLTD